MTFTATGDQLAWQAMQSVLAAMTQGSALIDEPTDPPADNTVAIVPLEGRVESVTLDTVIEAHSVRLRFYFRALSESRERVAFTLDRYRQQVLADIYGDFTLGGEVAYMMPADQGGFRWRYGWVLIAQTWFRVLDLFLSYRVQDQGALTP